MKITGHSGVDITISGRGDAIGLDSNIVATTGLVGEQFGVLVTIGAGVAEKDERGHGLRKAVRL